MGYPPYLKKIQDLTAGKELIATGMTHEVERCRTALKRAAEGAIVALVSSGDPGIYGMAGLALELAAADGLNVPIEVIPGVTAASAAAARMGAPLMVDFAVISLSDRLVAWEKIRARLEAAAAGDFVTALYNPRSRERVAQLEEAVAIFLKHRAPATPVGIGTAVGTESERILVCDLAHLLDQTIDMQTIVIVGSSTSKRVGEWFVTARGYHV